MAEIISFYSYKGGVGRSMAVVNIACLLARLRHRVLVVDFDLEAPGLHRYLLVPERDDNDAQQTPRQERLGIIDFFLELRARIDSEAKSADELILALLESGRFGYEVRLKLPGGNRSATLDFLSAGRFDGGYVERVRDFPWATFYQEQPGAFLALVAEWKRRYDYVLVDSRTGISDIGSVSTVILADKLVLAFTPNEQSLHGAVEFGRQAMQLKREVDLTATLPLFPLLARVDEGEEDERRRWVADAAHRFDELFTSSNEQGSVDFSHYFSTVHIPHRSYYAYGERIAVQEEESTAMGSLAEGYARFLECLMGSRLLGWEGRAVNATRPDIVRPPVLWLTYAHADNRDKDVDFIAQELKRTGLTVHLDRWVIGAGERLWDRIERGIRSSDAWMIYATSNSTASEPCREELAWALDRALDVRGGAYPIIALFPGGFDANILPSALKVRLCISTTDDDWRERILSAAAGRSPQITAPRLDPWVVKVHRFANPPFLFSIEMRPRAGVWSPFIIAVPIAEADWQRRQMLVFGGKDAPDPNAASALLSVGQGTEGPWSWLRVGGQQASPALSAYLHCNQLPSKCLFGAANGIQYIAEDLDGEIRITQAGRDA